MSVYAKVKEDALIKYPYTFDDLRAENPYTNFPDPKDLASLYVGTEDQLKTGAEIVEVFFTPVPVCDFNKQKMVPYEMPRLSGGRWLMGYELFDLPQEEIIKNSAAIGDAIKAKLNSVLSETAWTVEPNSGLSPEKIQEWISYRTAISQVSEQPEFPFNITIPVKPS